MDVQLLRWPAAQAQLEDLRAARLPRLIIVESDVTPPEMVDELEDWVRLPAERADIDIRAKTLARRAQKIRRPVLSNEGVMSFEGRSVPLSPVEAQVVASLMTKFEAVVSRRELTEAVWPKEAPPRNALDVHISRVRRRVAEVGLQIRTVRGRGYMLESMSEIGQQVAANG